ncbi:SDR family NAD(P)-dependent oxidoreductase [[Roseibacterium] beibuensis]|uniref:Short chain dehydrogenase n=1 Tax=[Roseibacterium] beibuensis TaxID=1193142 RepID=A0ABP9LAK4_9RHOB|nr:SDR family NAD(P)-dependent oxidoreductase [Roseibacterium beibuensis]
MIEGKTVIITGASLGIGEATAKEIAAKGAKVVSFALDMPEDTTVNEFTLGPATQSW